MLNTITFIIIAIIFATYVVRVINGIDNKTLHISDILVLIITFSIIVNTCVTNNKLEKAYNDGYSDAAISAELIEINEDCYHIAFGDEVHCYER